MANVDLKSLLPQEYRDKTIDTVINNTFNRFLKKPNVVNVSGYIGDHDQVPVGSTFITQPDLERRVNDLITVMRSRHGNVDTVTTWADIVDRLRLMGANVDRMDEWLRTEVFNFVPPVDLDKLINPNQYVWIGSWLMDHPEIDYSSLGIPSAGYVMPYLSMSQNDGSIPDYYVMKRGNLSGSSPSTTDSDIPWNSWMFCNLWVHIQDAIVFTSSNSSLKIDNLAIGQRPIIEYDSDLKLNSYVNNGAPGDIMGMYRYRPWLALNLGEFEQTKSTVNQPPQFDLYRLDGTHAGFTSSIFYFKETQTSDVDDVIGRRIAKDENGFVVFSMGIFRPDQSIFAFKRYQYASDENAFIAVLDLPWKSCGESAPRYVKLDEISNFINVDKLINFSDYVWADNSPTSYNLYGLPQYHVIETSGSSDWATSNHWVKKNSLPDELQEKFPQAVRPIFEYSSLLEPELLNPGKSASNQVPLFNFYSRAGDSFNLLTLTDAIRPNAIVLHKDDLTSEEYEIIKTNTKLSSCLVEKNGETFYQTLIGVKSLHIDSSVTYPFVTSAIVRETSWDGNLGITISQNVAKPDLYTLTCTGTNLFSVVSNRRGPLAYVSVGSVLTDGEVKITVGAGTSPAIGDKITFLVSTQHWVNENRYIKIGSSYRSFKTSDGFTYVNDSVIVPADINDGDGVWSEPPQFIHNIEQKVSHDISSIDLRQHLISIIQAQPGLVGYASGFNNIRQINIDFSRGGSIKLCGEPATVLFSLMRQSLVTMDEMIDGVREQYESILGACQTFIEANLSDLVDDGDVAIPTTFDVSQGLIDKFVETVKIPTNNDELLVQYSSTKV